jgi:signal transduction histidine kinase
MTMTIGAPPRRRGRWRGPAPLRHVWSAGTWLATTHLMVGLVLGLAGAALLVASVFTGGLLLLPCTALLDRWQRARFAAYLGIAIQRRPPGPGARWAPSRWWAALRSAALWRATGYHLLAGFVGPLSALVVIALWAAAFVFSTIALHAQYLPNGGAPGLPVHGRPGLAAVTAGGVLLLLLAPWVVRGAAALDALVAGALLEPRSRADLSRDVALLATSRAEVVAAADSERRRIERDLHDGAQQRLVSLAMNLGIARVTLADLPGPARAAIVDAHEEAKLALAELRGFVRGLHPAVLDDLGLDAALSGLTARCAIPVRLTVELSQRPSATIEAVAYFVVSEALANAARHAAASRVEVSVDQPAPDRIRIRVADDGRGGARADGGTGIRGLVQRVGSVDGTLSLSSPAGGPTVIVVELPCES